MCININTHIQNKNKNAHIQNRHRFIVFTSLNYISSILVYQCSTKIKEKQRKCVSGSHHSPCHYQNQKLYSSSLKY